MSKAKELLPRVKANLIIQHDEDDALLLGFIAAALDYAESYQKIKYGRKKLPPTTELAIVLLSSHLYESRDGSTGGFFSNYVGSVANVWQTVNRLLAMEKRWDV